MWVGVVEHVIGQILSIIARLWWDYDRCCGVMYRWTAPKTDMPAADYQNSLTEGRFYNLDQGRAVKNIHKA